MPQLVITPPSDLHLPSMRPHLDLEYGDAAWESIRRGTDDARRLARAIDWLDLIWRNASGLGDDLRIPALRAGFEVLFDRDETAEVRAALESLLGSDEEGVRVRRVWTNPRNGKRSESELTDLEWWFTLFSFLRNDLMHGREPPTEAWQFEQVSQVELGQWWLREAIKQTVGLDGHPDITEERQFREMVRALRESMRDRDPADG